MDKIIPGGFIEPKASDIKKQQGAGYILGAAGGIIAKVINPSGDWTAYAPLFEPQSYTEADRWLETNNCTGFGTCRAVATLLKFLYKNEYNYSERFLGIVANTNPAVGNDPITVAETARKSGFLPDFLLPFSADIKTREQYYFPKPMTPVLSFKAAEWNTPYALNHESVFKKDDDIRTKHAMLKDALTKGPVCVSVKAWKQNGQGLYYKSRGETDNHWTFLLRFDGENPIVGDSYLPYEKKLTTDYDFNFGEWYAINAKTETIKRGILQQIIDIYKQVIALLTKQITQMPIPLPPVRIVPDEVLPPITPPAPSHQSKIEVWALAIEKQEGGRPGDRNMRNNNSGNLKFSLLTEQLGATSKDPNGFCVFPTYQKGFDALCDFLKLACLDNLKAFHNARTILTFTKVYALPPNDNYALNVAKALGVDVNTNIKTLL